MSGGRQNVLIKFATRPALFAFTWIIVSLLMYMAVFLYGQRANVDLIGGGDPPSNMLFPVSYQMLNPENFMPTGEISCALRPDNDYDCVLESGKRIMNVPVRYPDEIPIPSWPPTTIACPRIQGLHSTVVIWDHCNIHIISEQAYITFTAFASIAHVIKGMCMIGLSLVAALALWAIALITDKFMNDHLLVY